MGWTVRSFEDTPNPNAVKCVLDHQVSAASVSFPDRASAQGNPVAEPLFAIEGVTGLLLNQNWITVNKRATAAWGPLQQRVEQALAAAVDPEDLDADEG